MYYLKIFTKQRKQPIVLTFDSVEERDTASQALLRSEDVLETRGNCEDGKGEWWDTDKTN